LLVTIPKPVVAEVIPIHQIKSKSQDYGMMKSLRGAQ